MQMFPSLAKNHITSSVKVSCFLASHWTRTYHVKVTVCFMESQLLILAVSGPENVLFPSVQSIKC